MLLIHLLDELYEKFYNNNSLVAITLIFLLRNVAVQLLNEITTTYPELLASASHISLQLSEGDTRLIIKSNVDFEQKCALLDILSGKGLKVVDCGTTDHGTVFVIY